MKAEWQLSLRMTVSHSPTAAAWVYLLGYADVETSSTLGLSHIGDADTARAANPACSLELAASERPTVKMLCTGVLV